MCDLFVCLFLFFLISAPKDCVAWRRGWGEEDPPDVLSPEEVE